MAVESFYIMQKYECILKNCLKCVLIAWLQRH